MNSFEKMTAFNKANPEAKEVYRKMQHWQVLNKPENGVFCPMYEVIRFSPSVYQECCMVGTNNLADLRYSTHKYISDLHVFGAWRNSLGIYVIDKDIIQDIVKSPIPVETPVDIFSRLPEWCVYMDMSALNYMETVKEGVALKIIGFWALYDLVFLNGKYQRILKLYVNIEGGNSDNLAPIIEMAIDNGKTVEQSINDAYKAEKDIDPIVALNYAKSDIDMLKMLLSMLLWLCAEEPDISNIQGEPVNKDALRLPKYRVNKKTGVFIPPDKPTIYDIGKRLGGEIRTFNERLGSGDSRISSRKRPHIRRGHWHGVWSGTGQNKEFKIYWQPAIFVNAR